MEAEQVYENLLWRDADRMSGATCFYGTRIPVPFLFEYIEQGESLETFAADYRIDVAVVRSVVHLAGAGLESLFQAA